MRFLRFIAAAGLAIEAAGHTQDDPGSFEEAQAQAHSRWDYTIPKDVHKVCKRGLTNV